MTGLTVWRHRTRCDVTHDTGPPSKQCVAVIVSASRIQHTTQSDHYFLLSTSPTEGELTIQTICCIISGQVFLELCDCLKYYLFLFKTLTTHYENSSLGLYNFWFTVKFLESNNYFPVSYYDINLYTSWPTVFRYGVVLIIKNMNI